MNKHMTRRNAKKKIKLGVNIDHIATLRQVRGNTTSYPDLMAMAKLCVKAGADQITIHLREDRRHIQVQDLVKMAGHLPVSLNLEMAATPEMLRMALKYRPDWCCFVPEKRAELTTEGGLNVDKNIKNISLMTEKLQSKGMEVSMFIEPSEKQILASHKVGADAVEFHTGLWVRLQGARKNAEWKRLVRAAEYAHALGLHVHAGHGLDYQTTRLIKKMPYLEEVNIGHSLICYSVETGIYQAVKKMKNILK